MNEDQKKISQLFPNYEGTLLGELIIGKAYKVGLINCYLINAENENCEDLDLELSPLILTFVICGYEKVFTSTWYPCGSFLKEEGDLGPLSFLDLDISSSDEVLD